MKRMHTEIERDLDADLRALGLDGENLALSGDDIVPELDIAFVDLEVPDPADLDGVPAAPAHTSSPPRAPAPRLTTLTRKTVRITIRLPLSVVDEFKRRAVAEEKGYQTLVVKALQEHLARGV